MALDLSLQAVIFELKLQCFQGLQSLERLILRSVYYVF